MALFFILFPTTLILSNGVKDYLLSIIIKYLCVISLLCWSILYILNRFSRFYCLFNATFHWNTLYTSCISVDISFSQEAAGKRSLMNMYGAIRASDGRPDHRHPLLRVGDSQHKRRTKTNFISLFHPLRYDYRYDGFEGWNHPDFSM